MEEAEQGKDDAAGRLTHDIFSLLERKLLFGCVGGVVPHTISGPAGSFPPHAAQGNKVCLLSIDGGARPNDGLLAAAALVWLEAALRQRAGKDDARLPEFFDVAAGSGAAGGVLAAMLFARGPDDPR